MRTKHNDPKVLELHDLESQRLWLAVVLLLGLGAAVYATGQLLSLMDTSLDQVAELSERVERLQAAPAPSTSEPAKT